MRPWSSAAVEATTPGGTLSGVRMHAVHVHRTYDLLEFRRQLSARRYIFRGDLNEYRVS